ncbi:MAG TPA: PQQ-binding-like beta-propeller repeat protein [Gemmataceae bacterium]|nr:PQQ-binding-like beta-propeller repeat protein [Gemmataceae bacterium]
MNQRITLFAALLAAGLATAAGWTQFRGPNGSGVSDETGLPTTWGPTENVRWKADLPGRSVASPVVWGKKVFITSATGPKFERLHTLCLDADTGKVLWQRQLAATGYTACHPKSSMAAPTPCVDANTVYCLFATADLAAYDHDGNLKWYRSLAGDYPGISNQVGMAASPVLAGDRLIVPMDTVGESFIAALDTTYGQNVWKVDRPKDINWVTPTLRTSGKRTEVIFSANREAIAYDAANGKKAWSFAAPGASVPTAVLSGERVLLPVAGALACLKPDGDRMVEVWRSPKLASGYTSPLVYKDRVYAIGRAGTLYCFDVLTGRELWSERIGKGKGAFWASPIAADGHIYTFDDAGNCAVVKAGDQPKVVATNDLKAEIMGTAAMANGAIYIPTVNGLYCIATKK